MIQKIKKVLQKTPLFPILLDLNSVIKKRSLKFDKIYGDVTNVCNLRCPHCYNDWSDPFLSKAVFMDKETFKKVVQLIPLTAKETFHFSCAFEPTLNPEFIDLINMIPRKLQKKSTVYN